MSNTKARLESRIKVEGLGWRYVPAAPRLGGAFHISWNQGTKRKRENVGTNWTAALKALEYKRAELGATAHGIQLVGKPEKVEGTKTGTLLTAAAEAWLTNVSKQRTHLTYIAYRVIIGKFLDSCKKVYLEDITKDDLESFKTYLRNQDLLARTQANNFSTILGFLKGHNIYLKVSKADWPQWDKDAPVEIYEPREIKALYRASSPAERLLWSFFLKTGMRELEAAHVCWKNLDTVRRIIWVTPHPEYKWKPKKGKSRSIPVPASLLRKLVKVKKAASGPLIFPGKGGGPDTALLRKLKAVAAKAGVEGAYLHKFRQTYGTNRHDAGVPDRTLMAWMGHTDMNTMKRYLRPAEGEQAQAYANKGW